MNKNEKIGIGTLILISIVIIVALAITKTITSQQEKNIVEQKPAEGKITQKQEEEKNEYSLEKAVENGYFVITHNKIYNKNKLEQFIKNTEINAKNRIEDSIKIMQYTVEGDPIITELIYKIKDETYELSGKTVNKTTYILKEDNTQDKCSVESDRIVTVNDDIPGEFYGITEVQDGDYMRVDLALYAEIDYVDESTKRYETINICSYPMNAEQGTNISVNNQQNQNDNSSINTSQENSAYFYGKVVESYQNYIIVEPNEGEEIRNSADKIEVSLGKNNDAIYEVGTNVKITYKGYIMESYPAKVDVTKIELKSTENFEIRFYDKQPQSNTKVHKILDKSETAKYDYDIYAYEGSVNILINGKEMSLREALLNNKITMNEIIAKANNDLREDKIKGDMYRDGGSMEYLYDNYTIVKFHKLDGKRDVYIGKKNMRLNDIDK